MSRKHYIRFFISSTFQDMKRERDAVTTLIDKLDKEYSQKKGWQIEYVDLRWGINDAATRDHRTMSICKEELHRCQKLSPKPNFIILLGERYGWIPLPEKIHKSIGNSLRLFPFFKKIYQLDYNDRSKTSYPSRLAFWKKGEKETDLGCWILMPYNQNWTADEVEKIEDDSKFFFSFLTKSKIWKKKLDDSVAIDLFSSATEQEIYEGALSVEDSLEHVIYYNRTLKCVPKDLKDIFQPSEGKEKLEDLKEKVKKATAQQHRIEYNDKPFDSYICDNFISEFSEDMEKRLRSVIDAEIERTEKDLIDPVNETLSDCYDFLNATHLSPYVVRTHETNLLNNFIFNPSLEDTVFWVTGPDGSGKSALLKYALNLISKNNNTDNTNSIHAFYFRCGLTKWTNTAENLALIINESLKKLNKWNNSDYKSILKKNPKRSSIPFLGNNSLTDTISYLDQQLSKSNFPIFILIDGIDNLDKETIGLFYGLQCFANRKGYFNKRTVKFIVSSTQPYPYKGTIGLKELIMSKLSPKESSNLVDKLMAKENRCLTKEQHSVLEKSLYSTSHYPLFLTLLSQYLSKYAHSWDRFTNLPNNIDDLIFTIIETIVTKGHHDRYFTLLCLAIIVTSDGISDKELRNVISSDQNVMKTFHDSSHHEIRENSLLPSIFWHRLSYDLRGLIEIAMSPYGEVNKCTKDSIRQSIYTYLHSIKDLPVPDICDYALMLQYNYFNQHWLEGNLHAIYHIGFLTFKLKGETALLNLLHDLRFTSRFAEYFGYLIPELFLLTTMPDDCPHIMNWLIELSGNPHIVIQRNAFMLPDNDPVRLCLMEKDLPIFSLKNVIGNLAFKNSIVYCSWIRGANVICMSGNANKILYKKLDNKTLAIVNRDNRQVTTWTSSDYITRIKTNKELNIVCVQYRDNSIAILKICESLSTVDVIFTYAHPVTEFTLEPKGKQAAFISNSFLFLFDIDKRKITAQYTPDSVITDIQYSKSGNTLWTIIGDSIAWIRDTESKRCRIGLNHLPEEEREIEKKEFINSARILASTDKNILIRVASKVICCDCSIIRSFRYPLVNQLTNAGIECAKALDETSFFAVGNSIKAAIDINGYYNLETAPANIINLSDNCKYALTANGDICDLSLTYKSFECREKGLSVSSDFAGSWFILSHGERHDDVRSQVCLVQPPETIDVVNVPFASKNDYTIPIAASAVSPDGSLCAFTTLESQTIDLLITDRQLKPTNIYSHSFEDSGLGNYENQSIRSIIWSSDSQYLLGSMWHHIVSSTANMLLFNREGVLLQAIKSISEAPTNYYITLFTPNNHYAIQGLDDYEITRYDFVKKEWLPSVSVPGCRRNILDNSPIIKMHPSGKWFITNERITTNKEKFPKKQLSEFKSKIYDNNTLDNIVFINIETQYPEPSRIPLDIQKVLAISPSGRFVYCQSNTNDNQPTPILICLDMSTLKENYYDINPLQVTPLFSDQYIYVRTYKQEILLVDMQNIQILSSSGQPSSWHSIPMKFTSKGLFTVNSSGSPIVLSPNFPLQDIPIVTITKRWSFKKNTYDSPDAVCPCCGKRFTPNIEVINLLREPEIRFNVDLFNNPLLQNHNCPNCKRKIRFNYYLA